MPLRRKSEKSEATRLEQAFERAEAELREREEQLATVEAEVAKEKADAAAALGLGELTVDEREQRKRVAEDRAEEARAARTLAAEVVEALRPRAVAASGGATRSR